MRLQAHYFVLLIVINAVSLGAFMSKDEAGMAVFCAFMIGASWFVLYVLTCGSDES